MSGPHGSTAGVGASEASVRSPGTRNASPFTGGTVLALVVVGIVAFIAMLYFLGAGDTGQRRNMEAHAAANGLNGYSGLVRLLETEGVAVERARTLDGSQQTDLLDLLVLTPAMNTDPEEITRVLESRRYQGPTLLIVPKWIATPPPSRLSDEDKDRVRDDWVQLTQANAPRWAADLTAPFDLQLTLDRAKPDIEPATFKGLDVTGALPRATVLHAQPDATFDPVVIDSSGRVLALDVLGEEGSDFYNDSHIVTIVVEPDLLNNYGLADQARARLALELVQYAGYGEIDAVTFDMTLAGLGNATNLLTLAFRPPFLAATICLIIALSIVGWRAFLRFGPATASRAALTYGKSHLVENGAGLVIRARRTSLLAKPYARLIERRLARLLGMTNPNREEIDEALAARFDETVDLSSRIAALEAARRPSDILRLARSLHDLTGKLSLRNLAR